MIELTGKYTNAIIYTDNCEAEAQKQILDACNHPAFENCPIKIMPDVHAGAGCVIGFTAPLSDKVIPNIIGVDIGCFSGDTQVSLTNGTTESIYDLTLRKEPFYVFSVRSDGKITYGKARAFKTRTLAKLLKVTLDTGEVIHCTPEHCFLTRDRNWVEAKDLVVNQSLFPLYTYRVKSDAYARLVARQPVRGHKTTVLHRSFMVDNLGRDLTIGECVHHIDGNPDNNDITNLALTTMCRHSSHHAKELQRFKDDDFKAKRLKALEEQKVKGTGWYSPTNKLNRRKRAISNITGYMENNREDFLEKVKNNGKRGAFYLKRIREIDPSFKMRRILGIAAKIYLRLLEAGLELNSESRNKCKQYKSSIGYNRTLELLDTYDMKISDLCAPSTWKDKILNNHKVKGVEEVEQPQDVYCLEVDEHHNFALAAGVFVHNCNMRAAKIKPCATLKDFDKLDKVIRESIPSGFAGREKPHRRSKELKGEIEFVCSQVLNCSELNHIVRLSSLGGGNHFLELNQDSQGDVWLVVHSGSRNFGNMIAKHYQRLAIENQNHYLKPLCYLEGSQMGDYLRDMRIAQRYASLNTELILEEIVSGMNWKETDHFQTIHNYIDDTNTLRKGAVSAHEGQRVLIPLNMRDGSIICKGKGNKDWNTSAPHGAGRIMSRGDAKRTFTLEAFQQSMEGIYTTCVSQATLDEAPMVYKDGSEIMSLIGDAVDIIDVIKPLYNFKG